MSDANSNSEFIRRKYVNARRFFQLLSDSAYHNVASACFLQLRQSAITFSPSRFQNSFLISSLK